MLNLNHEKPIGIITRLLIEMAIIIQGDAQKLDAGKEHSQDIIQG